MPPWVDRWIAHANGCLLFPWTDADWHRRLLDAVPLVVLLDRPKFDHPTPHWPPRARRVCCHRPRQWGSHRCNGWPLISADEPLRSGGSHDYG